MSTISEKITITIIAWIVGMRQEAALLAVDFAALEVAVAVVPVPLPPTGLAFADVVATATLPTVVVEATVPLAGAFRTLPTEMHIPAFATKPEYAVASAVSAHAIQELQGSSKPRGSQLVLLS